MHQKKIYQYQEATLWVLNPLLIVLCLYSEKMNLGLVLQWLGKFHPLLLHFPIVLGTSISLYLLFFNKNRLPESIEKNVFASNALLSSLVAILGVFLSKQDSYDASLLLWHKWGGAGIALLSWGALYIPSTARKLKIVFAVIFLFVIAFFTHKGAQLTHGVNAISFPQKKAEAVLPKEVKLDSNTTVYEKAVATILEQKCVGCHGTDKIKGSLQLNSIENILKGGKGGSILVGINGKEASLIERIHMPLGNEKHMPPDGKLQLTPSEISILNQWVKAGGNFKTKMNQLAKTDSLYLLANNYVPLAAEKKNQVGSFPDLSSYNSNYCSVNYLYHGSDQVEVTFFQGSFYNHALLKKLEKLKGQIIHLNMQGMPLKNEDIELISQFSNLKKLNLNYTKLNLKAIEAIKKMESLSALSICGMEINETTLSNFLSGARFSQINVWANNINIKQLQNVIAKYPKTKIIVGDNLENDFVKVSSPTIEQDSSIIANHLDVKLKNLLNGVVIRYTTDGSEPDSLTSPKYNTTLRFTQNTTLKARAFKVGWLSSNTIQRTFYKSEIHPDTTYLITKPDPKYTGSGANTLVDYELGDQNFANGKWLGYKDATMEFVVGFKQAKTIKQVYFNSLVDYGAYIMPVVSILVQGSDDGKNFKRIKETKYPIVIKPATMRETKSFSCVFPENTKYRYYKFTVLNIKKLPEWHPGKGTPGWIFIDELFLN